MSVHPVLFYYIPGFPEVQISFKLKEYFGSFEKTETATSENHVTNDYMTWGILVANETY